MKHSLITPGGLARIERELDHLVGAGREGIQERLRLAIRTDANVLENADYSEALRDLAALERRVAVLRERIASAQVVEPDRANAAIEVGERVRVRVLSSGETAEYQLVGLLEADPYSGRISILSPLGQALLGKRAGDTAVVDAPRGRLRYEILATSATDGSAPAACVPAGPATAKQGRLTAPSHASPP